MQQSIKQIMKLVAKNLLFVAMIALLVFPTARLDAAAVPLSQLDDSTITRFVNDWFGLFDRFEDENVIILTFAQENLLIEMQGATLRTASDFKTWYKGVRDSASSYTHTVGPIRITRLPNVDVYDLNFTVVQKKVSTKGVAEEYSFNENWEVVPDESGKPLIKYRKSLLAPKVVPLPVEVKTPPVMTPPSPSEPSLPPAKPVDKGPGTGDNSIPAPVPTPPAPKDAAGTVTSPPAAKPGAP